MKIIILMLLVLLYSCKSNKEENSIVSDSKQRIIVDKHKDICEIVLHKNLNEKQRVIIDSTTNNVSKIENIIRVNEDSNYINTYLIFDKNGNVLSELSHYYEIAIKNEKEQIMLYCRFNKMNLSGNRKILYGKYNSDFVLPNASWHEYFEIDNLTDIIAFPLKNIHLGENKIRFMVYDTIYSDGMIDVRSTYIEKTIFMK